ncbi:hypothetical protein N9A94_04970 [Akkermansiaceae bacterium]|nr:hypothetical protein [Akkermansiaceae bacterium]MDB4537291.1 hypothetical protein [Akkermansiaceae bacterium]
MKAPLFLLSLLQFPLFGATPFVEEAFTSQSNTSRWWIYRFDTGAFSAPDWNQVNSNEFATEASTIFQANDWISILATQSSSAGTFTGDYTEAGITEVVSDFYAEDSLAIDWVEFFLLDGDTGKFYYSYSFIPGADGWSVFSSPLKTEPWITLFNGEYVDAFLTADILDNVEQIGLNIIPFDDSAIGTRVGIDNFVLLAGFESPKLSLEKSGSQITLTFPREDGFYYTIQSNPDLSEDNWSPLSLETTDLEGSSPFSTTIEASGRQFLRVLATPIFKGVPDIAG